MAEFGKLCCFSVAITLFLALGPVSAKLKEECIASESRNATLKIADADQCDKYYECGKNGKTVERLCDDGFQFSEEIRDCDYPHNVKCKDRKNLQPSQSTNPLCPRRNGFYPFPPAESCSKFYHCLEGTAYEKQCPEAVIFDPSIGTCIQPDLSSRKDCSASTVLNFKCPERSLSKKLRFGDHDRFATPGDCRSFFICLADGNPRKGSCPWKTVFNPKTGTCDKPSKVPECKDYYTNRPKEEGVSSEESDEDLEPTSSNQPQSQQPQQFYPGATSNNNRFKGQSQ